MIMKENNIKGEKRLIEKTDFWGYYETHKDMFGNSYRVLIAWHPTSLINLLAALEEMGVKNGLLS